MSKGKTFFISREMSPVFEENEFISIETKKFFAEE